MVSLTGNNLIKKNSYYNFLQLQNYSKVDVEKVGKIIKNTFYAVGCLMMFH